MEIWKDIEGYEGIYQVSNEGRVKSLNYNHTNLEHLLVPSTSRGYLHVNLWNNGKRKMMNIHRLVAEAFLPNPNDFPQVNHKDECKTNNFVFINEDESIDFDKSNLEWYTHKYNTNYGSRNVRAGEAIARVLSGRIPKCSPPKKVYQYTLDGELVATYESASEAARQNGYNEGKISMCCNGKRKTHKGYKWSYEPL